MRVLIYADGRFEAVVTPDDMAKIRNLAQAILVKEILENPEKSKEDIARSSCWQKFNAIGDDLKLDFILTNFDDRLVFGLTYKGSRVWFGQSCQFSMLYCVTASYINLVSIEEANLRLKTAKLEMANLCSVELHKEY